MFGEGVVDEPAAEVVECFDGFAQQRLDEIDEPQQVSVRRKVRRHSGETEAVGVQLFGKMRRRGIFERQLDIDDFDVRAFDKVYEQYRLAPDVTRRRMYYETMEQVLSKVDKTIIEAPGVTSYLPLPELKRTQPQQQEGAR